MASSALAASPLFQSLPALNPSKKVSVRTSVRRLPVAASAAPSGAAAAARDRRRFLERYGLNPDDFKDDAEENTREERRDRRRRRRSGRGEEAAEAVVGPSKSAEPRETHKMLQLLKKRYPSIDVLVQIKDMLVAIFSFQQAKLYANISIIIMNCQVLGGKVRRRKLLSPKDRNVRPMMEVVRGAAFDILQAHFVEMDPWVISEVLKPNLECTGFLDVSHIHMLRVEKFLANAEKSQGKYPSFDYISVTPPYLEVNYSTLLDQLARSPLVGKDCFIVSSCCSLVEYPLKTDMSESCGNLIKVGFVFCWLHSSPDLI
ncbi:hypothetical protein HU200_048090 [Digitaria exilis]|uniref:Uncharacterized protein n=1 Tax=Digitaria exilis TaxID=1010633 RepID=A0A835EAX6_9POAL|nr:hypothetical protein HU200_048090 [Digitaria exilis]